MWLVLVEGIVEDLVPQVVHVHCNLVHNGFETDNDFDNVVGAKFEDLDGAKCERLRVGAEKPIEWDDVVMVEEKKE